MTRCHLFVAVLLVAALLGGAARGRADTLPATPATPSPTQTRPPALATQDAQKYAQEVVSAAHYISRQYVQPVEARKLAAHAILALYALTATPLPESLRGDPAKIFEGKDLHEELWRARVALGNPSPLSFQHRRDVRLSIQAMLSSLDPYSMLVPQEESLRGRDRTQSNIGILLEERERGGPCIVQNLVLGGPAQQAGILPGDQLLAVEGQPIAADRPARLVVQDLDGPAESTLSLTIQSPNEPTPRTVRVVRNITRETSVSGHRLLAGGAEPAWEYLLGTRQRIALVRLGTLTSRNEYSEIPNTVDHLTEVLHGLQRDGLAGLILDLRDCPGGSMEGALQVAGLFIPEGVIAQVRYRRQEAGQIYHAQGDGVCYRTPMMVPIGPNTMGGGELIAAALQDHGRAILVGQRTRGKASIQSLESIQAYPHNYQVRITTGFFLRPKGGNLNRFTDSKPHDEWGVHPDEDFEVRLSPLVLRQVRRWRLQQDLGTNLPDQPLPLDRLENDPVLHLAVQSLLKTK